MKIYVVLNRNIDWMCSCRFVHIELFTTWSAVILVSVGAGRSGMRATVQAGEHPKVWNCTRHNELLNGAGLSPACPILIPCLHVPCSPHWLSLCRSEPDRLLKQKALIKMCWQVVFVHLLILDPAEAVLCFVIVVAVPGLCQGHL